MPPKLRKKPPPLNSALPPSKCSCVNNSRVAWGLASAWLWWSDFTTANAPDRVIRTVNQERDGNETTRTAEVARMANNTLLIPETVAPEVIVLTRSSGRTPTLHIPGRDGTPVCNSPLRAAKKTTGGIAPNEDSLEYRYRRKSIDVYPEPWRVWCGKCCKRVVREGPDVLPERPLDPAHADINETIDRDWHEARHSDGRFAPVERREAAQP